MIQALFLKKCAICVVRSETKKTFYVAISVVKVSILIVCHIQKNRLLNSKTIGSAIIAFFVNVVIAANSGKIY